MVGRSGRGCGDCGVLLLLLVLAARLLLDDMAMAVMFARGGKALRRWSRQDGSRSHCSGRGMA